MSSRRGIRLGIEAGLLAGLCVAVLFFLLDLARLQPLGTPLALSARLLGPTSPVLDLPVVSRVLTVAVFAGGLITFTLLHFLAFAALGICAVEGCGRLGIPLNVVTGALFGLFVGTVAFFGCMAVAGTQILDAPIGLKGVAVANLVAGMTMGGFVQARRIHP